LLDERTMTAVERLEPSGEEASHGAVCERMA